MSSNSSNEGSKASHVELKQEQREIHRPHGVQDCLACRIIGTTALGGVGVYALKQSRASAPGSAAGKRVMAGLGVCFLVASALRWTVK